MFGHIEGTLLSRLEHRLIMSTQGGIGLEIYYKAGVPLEVGKNYKFFLTTIVRENQIDIYAHDSVEEKKFFELLNKVKGVGPKTAYSIINFSSINELCQNIASKNEKYFKQIPGLGMKTSAQIILDLSKDIFKFQEGLSAQSPRNSQIIEAREALLNLGFERGKIETLLNNVLSKTEGLSVSEVVKEALKELRRQ